MDAPACDMLLLSLRVEIFWAAGMSKAGNRLLFLSSRIATVTELGPQLEGYLFANSSTPQTTVSHTPGLQAIVITWPSANNHLHKSNIQKHYYLLFTIQAALLLQTYITYSGVTL